MHVNEAAITVHTTPLQTGKPARFASFLILRLRFELCTFLSMPLIAPLQMALPLLREAITFRSATPAVSFVAIECMGNAVMQNVS